MAKEFAKPFYDSKAWQKCRRSYIANRISIDGGMCEVCHERPGLIVHHKIWLTPYNINDPEISLNFSNLRYECQECHNMEDDGTGKIRMPKYQFDSEGNPVGIPPI